MLTAAKEGEGGGGGGGTERRGKRFGWGALGVAAGTERRGLEFERLRLRLRLPAGGRRKGLLALLGLWDEESTENLGGLQDELRDVLQRRRRL